ncbi:hypothetical protein P879_04558 [Paragonimus westermani]|uniref:Uncharacterized protein n=1 Tax=Paragonimus westermani TaxID=34504 RepID=A0A8T0DAG0_9TREM|nr:hypothetical protein P879_04558 [Paragonimus westermani]
MGLFVHKTDAAQCEEKSRESHLYTILYYTGSNQGSFLLNLNLPVHGLKALDLDALCREAVAACSQTRIWTFDSPTQVRTGMAKSAETNVRLN